MFETEIVGPCLVQKLKGGGAWPPWSSQWLCPWTEVSRGKRVIFMELIIVRLCMLVMNKDILVIDEGPTQGLDDTKITSEAKYHINFTQLGKKLC